MKNPRYRSPSPRILSALLAVLFMLVGLCVSQAQQIAARPLTPQEISKNNLPAGTITSGGLLAVGLGEPVYLEVQVPKGTVVSTVNWAITRRPLGGSTAELQDSPIPASMPIYSIGDRVIMDAVGRKMFVPDVEGKYTITADVNTDGGLLNLEAVVAGALYVGVGTMDFASPAYPQCALCHPNHAITYMETGHASAFSSAVDGGAGSHFAERCISCHSLGKSRADNNGSFFSVANDLGWTLPETLEPGNWTAMPAELKAMANVQCEHCHGAGSVHHGDIQGTAVSLSSGDCGQCHDAAPYHTINQEWELSRHAVATRYPTGPGRGSCVECHSGIGFIEEMDGVADKSTDYEAITCAACHDPHSAENTHQLRTLADVTLRNGHTVTMGGTGMLCVNCHKGRQNSETYVQGNVSSHFGPHYGIQGDLFHGTNAIEYGKVAGGPSAHLYAVQDSCAGCHMNTGNLGDAPANSAGGHTFRVVSLNGTPDDDSDDIDMVGACTDCHGPIESFDMVRGDYNLDGVAEGVQTEVHHLLEALAMLLPPIGEPTMTINTSYPYSDKEKKALYNYLCAEEDGSFGLHNPRYITGILKASIEDLKDPFNPMFSGMNIPVGGEWFYSSWFDFYAPQAEEGWIYHFEHGHLFVQGTPEMIWLYEDRSGTWRYTSKDLYPVMYSPDGGWVYYAGVRGMNRMFYYYGTGEWMMIE